MVGASNHASILKHAALQITTFSSCISTLSHRAFAYIAPIVAVFLGWTILDESVTYLTIVATIVILVGVALIVRERLTTSNCLLQNSLGHPILRHL